MKQTKTLCAVGAEPGQQWPSDATSIIPSLFPGGTQDQPLPGICHPAFSDFCNTICQKRSSASMRMMAANRGKHRRAQRNSCDALSRLSVITDGTEHVYRCGLFHSLEHQFNYPTTGPRRIAPLHFISGDRDRSWLRST